MEDRYVNPVTAIPATLPDVAGRGANQAAMPNTANMPAIPYMTNTPNMPNAAMPLNTPNMPGVPAMATHANMPNTANMPNSPNMANMPNSANRPNAAAPNMANSPNAANMPNAANRPNAAVPSTANAPKTPNRPNAANAPNTPNTASIPNMANPPKIAPMQSNTAAPNANSDSGKACTYKQGELPSCAPLAAGYVPYQQKNPPKYSNEDALTRGTLFPGLDLPFMNVTNKNNPYAGTPRGEMMALGFAIHELTLYLDTHKDDKDAFDMLRSLIALQREGQREYVKRFGPVSSYDLEYADRYSWTDDPWPWDYNERTGK